MTTDDATPLSQETIVEFFNSGELIAYIFNYDFDDEEPTLAVYADLHNCGKINLLSLVQWPKFESVSQQLFFVGQNFFCKIIPRLQASTDEMMNCVSRLVKKAGQDMAATQPYMAFRQWCSLDITRAQEVIKLARSGDALACEFLTFALEVGNFLEEALDILQTYSDSRRLSAITAIGRMNWQDEKSTLQVLDAFLNVLENGEDDTLYANVLVSAFEIVARRSPDLKFVEIVRRVSQSARASSALLLRAYYVGAYQTSY